MKFLSLLILGAIGYVVVNHGVPFDIQLPKKIVYISEDCQCPTLPKDYFIVESTEQSICNGAISTFLMKEVRQVKVDLEEKLANY